MGSLLARKFGDKGGEEKMGKRYHAKAQIVAITTSTMVKWRGCP